MPSESMIWSHSRDEWMMCSHSRDVAPFSSAHGLSCSSGSCSEDYDHGRNDIVMVRGSRSWSQGHGQRDTIMGRGSWSRSEGRWLLERCNSGCIWGETPCIWGVLCVLADLPGPKLADLCSCIWGDMLPPLCCGDRLAWACIWGETPCIWGVLCALPDLLPAPCCWGRPVWLPCIISSHVWSPPLWIASW